MTAWPELVFADYQATAQTLQLWSQITGKVRLAQTPWLNHSWHVPLYVTARGLGTGLIPHQAGAFDIEFDFVAQSLKLRGAEAVHELALTPMTVATFYTEVMEGLDAIGAPVTIHASPNEVPDATPFPDDHAPREYRPEQAQRLWRALQQAERVLNRFRTGFLGKSSPVHFFWGSFDLATTRFSGRRAPPHPGGVLNLPDAVAREAYSHEVSSAGFWPGGGGVDHAAFYAYAYPQPSGYAEATVGPVGARYDAALGEFILPYDAVRAAPDPDAALLRFLQTTYEAAADLAKWDRDGLECGLGQPGRPRPV